MKTWMKWLLGVVVIGIIVVCTAAIAFFAIDRLQSPVVSFGIRTGRLWDDQRELRFRDLGEMHFFDRDNMPYHDLDEMPFYGIPRDRFYSNTFPLRLIGLPLLCLGFLFALGLGAVTLIVLLTIKSRPAASPSMTAAQPPPPVPAAPPVAPDTGATCAHCGKPAQSDWSHCPFCGAKLATATGTDIETDIETDDDASS